MAFSNESSSSSMLGSYAPSPPNLPPENEEKYVYFYLIKYSQSTLAEAATKYQDLKDGKGEVMPPDDTKGSVYLDSRWLSDKDLGDLATRLTEQNGGIYRVHILDDCNAPNELSVDRKVIRVVKYIEEKETKKQVYKRMPLMEINAISYRWNDTFSIQDDYSSYNKD